MIIVDTRETDLQRALQSDFVSKQLSIGDVHIDDIWILERKTIADLNASIMDGRFADQRARLRELAGSYKIGYIIEGVPDNRPHLVAALTSLAMEFCIFPSRDVVTSALHIKKIHKGQNQSCISSPKSKVETPLDLLRATLLAVPKLGAGSVDAIVTRYASIGELIAGGYNIDGVRLKSGRLCPKVELRRYFEIGSMPH